MSEEDIPAGARWSSHVTTQLERAHFGIICLTAENLDEPWILFESGALAKTVEAVFVCPYLFGIEPSDVRGPLAQFQAKRATKTDTLDLLRSLNQRLAILDSTASLSENDLLVAFERWWPDLEQQLEKVPDAKPNTSPRRDQRQILEELLELTRQIARQLAYPPEPSSEKKAELAAFRNFIRARHATLAGFMELGASLTISGELLTVIPRSEIYSRYLSDNLAAIGKLAAEFFGRDIRVKITAPAIEAKKG